MSEEGKIIAGQRLYVRDTEAPRTVQTVKTSTVSHYWFFKISLILLMVCAFIWCWQKALNPRTFPVKRVEVQGQIVHIDHAKLQRTILNFSQNGFLSMDVSKLQDRLQQIPWVESASVKRVWLDTLSIHLTEQQPIARLSDTTLLNKQGEVFTVDSSTIPAELPLFQGTLEQHKLLFQNYQVLSNVLMPLHLGIKMISVDPRESWILQLTNGMTIYLGRVDPIARLQRFVNVYSQVVANRDAEIDLVDLRYANGIALKWRHPRENGDLPE